MNTKRMRLAATILGVMVLTAPFATAVSAKLVFTNLKGRLRIEQNVPCGAVVDAATSIIDGRFDMSPSRQGRDLNSVQIDLSRMEVFFTPFSIDHECQGIRASAEFREIGVKLARAVRFTAESIGNPEDMQYRFSIPKREVLIFESVLDNMPVQQPETNYQKPSEDITGVLDLRRGTAQLHVALASQLHFRAGCVGKRCMIDEVLKGTQTVDITGQVAIANPARTTTTKTKR